MNAPVKSNLAALRAAPQQADQVPVTIGFGSSQSFDLIQRVSKMFASSTLVPAAYQGNMANCCIALNMAQRMGADPMQVMQNLYIVHGSPSWSSKFLIATVNTCGRFSALRYEWRGKPSDDEYGCRAWAIEKATGERLDGIWVDWKMVKAEGWSKKNGSKWNTMPDQMFVYRAAAFWQRAYAPELGMGLATAEEMVDVIDINGDGTYSVTTEELRVTPARTAEVVSQDTGEIVEEPAPAAPYDVMFKRINSATDIDVLDLVTDEVRYLESQADQDKLFALAAERRATLEQQ
ncbi:MAG TPA: hypothetical protein VNS29_15360 [Burkholderiaceae bacterium]|nr:hypothetical protein [Burkholderiaceae bacterium]